MDYEEFAFSLLDTEPTILGVAIIKSGGNLEYQTDNWEISADVPQIMSIASEAQQNGQSPGSLSIMKLKYMIVEFTPERIIATNVTRKGHIIIAPIGNGALVTFIDPAAGPRDALFNVQNFAAKLK
jgi:hypothetical protein